VRLSFLSEADGFLAGVGDARNAVAESFDTPTEIQSLYSLVFDDEDVSGTHEGEFLVCVVVRRPRHN
jgi:hypothetical protein